MKKLFALLTFCALLMACSKENIEVSMDDISIEYVDFVARCTYKGESFSGKAFNKDRSVELVVENGEGKFLNVYHKNGNMAIHSNLTFEAKWLDEDGNEMSKWDFIEKYPGMTDKMLEELDKVVQGDKIFE